VGRDADENVLGTRLCVFDEDVEIAVLVEHTRVEQLVLPVVAAARPTGLRQVSVGEARLRVLVEELQVRVGRRAVDVEVVLLHVLAVVAFAVGEAEEAFLQDRVLFVPQGDGEAQPLFVVADAADAVFTPAVSARSSLIVGEVVPSVAVDTVVLAHGAPLPLAEIGPPLLPRRRPAALRFQALALFSLTHRLSLHRATCSRQRATAIAHPSRACFCGSA
jgi:hypothetical protein